MAKLAAYNTRVYFEHYLIGDVFNTAEVDMRRGAPQVTGFGESGPRRVVGQFDYSMRCNGFNDFVDNDVDEVLHAAHNTADRALLFRYATGRGEPGYDGIIDVIDQPRVMRVAEAAAISLSGEGSGGLMRGTSLTDDEETFSSAVPTPGVNCGATTTSDTVAVVVRVVADDFSSATLNIQQSSDNGSGDAFANISDLSGFSLSTVGVTRKTTSAATEAWKRINISAFSGTSATIVVMIGKIVTA